MARSFTSLLLIIAITIPSIKMDFLVPCFPELAQYFNVSSGTIQLLFTFTFLGYCFGAVFSGPLSDCYGRRKVIIIGNAIMLISTLVCACAQSINILLLLHFLQGVGSSVMAILVYAIIADLYENNKAILLIGTINATIAISMIIAI